MRADVRARSPWRPGAGLAGNRSRGAAARAGAMAKLLSCVLGPRLYQVYRERHSERRPEAPASVTAPPPSSWVSRGLPPWRHGTARAPLGLAPRKRPLWEIGGACLSSQLCAQAAWCFLVQSRPGTGHPDRCLPSPPPSPAPCLSRAAPPGRRGSCPSPDSRVLGETLRGLGRWMALPPNSPFLQTLCPSVPPGSVLPSR